MEGNGLDALEGDFGLCVDFATSARLLITLDTNLNSKSGSGTGIRTLNLAVNRSLPLVQKSLVVFAACR